MRGETFRGAIALLLMKEELKAMKVLFRALLLVLAFLFALGLIKWLFVKVLFFAFWVAAISVVVFVIYSIVKPTT